MWIGLLSSFLANASVPISGPTTICAGATITLSAPPGYVFYNWSTGARAASIAVTAAGRYSVTVTDSIGGTDIGFVDITEGIPPKPTIGNPVEFICSGEYIDLRAQRSFMSYLWSTGETTSEIRVWQSGTYSLTVVDSGGCVGVSDITRLVVVKRQPPTIIGVNAVCNNSVAFYNTPNSSGVTYSWTVDGGTIEAGQSSSSIKVRWDRTGRLDLKTSVLRPDGGTCDTSASLFVRVGDKLQPELLSRKNSICQGDSLVLTAAAGFASYVWNTGQIGPSIVVRTGGSYYVTVTDSTACNGTSDTLRVRIWPKPNMSISGASALCAAGTATLQADAEGDDVVFWEWNTGERTRTKLVTTPGTYSVVGWTLDGCSDTVSLIVTPVTNIDVTADFVNFDTTYVGSPVLRVMRIYNNSNTSITVTGFNHGSTDITSNPIPPFFIDSKRWVDVALTWLPYNEGEMSATVQVFVQSGTCIDTAVSIVGGFALRQIGSSSIHIVIPDTVASIGDVVKLHVGAELQQLASTITKAQVDLTWNNHFFLVDGFTNAVVARASELDGMKTVTLVLNVANLNQGIIISGTLLLTHPFKTSLIISNVLVESTSDSNSVTWEDGSVTGEGCFLNGRFVRISGSVINSVNVYDVLGRKIKTVPYSEFEHDTEFRFYSGFAEFVASNGDTIGYKVLSP